MYEYDIHQHEVNLLVFVKNCVSQLRPEQPDAKTLRTIEGKPVNEILRNFGTALVRV